MPEFNYIHNKEDIKDALRRNKMQGHRSIGLQPKEIKPKNDLKELLEMYLFSNLNMTPVELLRTLESQHYSGDDFRYRRQRNIDFTRGRHFGELVYDAELKKYITQWQYLKRRNMPPLTYNVVSKLMRSLVGQFREINTGNIVKCESKDVRGQEIAHILTECLNRIKRQNKGKQKDARNMKEMLLSGRPIFKVFWGSKNNLSKKDVRFRVVNTAKFGVNPGVTDEDFANLNTAYEIHDTDINDIIEMFSGDDYERGVEIRHRYIKHQGDQRKQAMYSSQSYDGSELRNLTFNSTGTGNSSCRYFEVWTKISDYEASTYDPLEVIGNDYKTHKWRNPVDIKKEIDIINQERIANSENDIPHEDLLIQFNTEFRSRWYVSYITPWGYVLDVRESPYKNGLMPYVMPSPDINGEMWGLIEEVIPAQLSLDRQILQGDAIISNASKGVWLVPDTAVPDDMSNREYLTEIKKVDGAVIYKVREGMEDHVPKQLYANSANVSNQVQQLIDLYAGLVDEISGNYGAAQGKSGSSNTTATGYALESQNASLNIRDTIETYLDVILQRDELSLMFILEGYTKHDYFKITGKEIDPKEIKMYEFSIEQSKGTNSPSHRMVLEQELLQQVMAGLLPYEVYLDISNNPVMIQAKQKLQEYNKTQAINAQNTQQSSNNQLTEDNIQPTLNNQNVDEGQISEKGIERLEKNEGEIMYKVQPKGLNIKDNDRNIPDGFLKESINLQWRDGTYRPIAKLLNSGIIGIYASNKIILHKVSDEDTVNVLIFESTGLWWIGYIENGVYSSISPIRISLPIVTDYDSLSFTILNGIIYFMSVTQEFYYKVSFDETIGVAGDYVSENMYDWKGNYPLFKELSYSGTIPTGYNTHFSGMLLMRYTFVLDTGEEVMHSPIYPYKVQALVPTSISSGDALSNIHTIIYLSLSYGLSISDRIVGVNVYTTPINSTSTFGFGVGLLDIPDIINSMISDNMYLAASFDIGDVLSPNSKDFMVVVGDLDVSYYSGVIVDSNVLPAGKPIPVDNFTHHQLFGKITNSNGRLIINTPKVKMTNGYLRSCCREQASGGWTGISNNFAAKTEDGLVKGVYETQVNFDGDASVFRAVVSYPDYRATNVGILATGTSSGYYKYNLTPKPEINMSTSFNIFNILIASGLYNVFMNYNVLSAQLDDGNSYYKSDNRIQFSEIGEFSVWPVINSYRVGEGKIVFVGSNSIDPANSDYISPLLIGTSDGVYTVNFDPSGSNLIQSITKTANIPALSDKNILIDQNLIYVSDKGLIVINNGRVINITEDYFPEHGNGNFPDNNTAYPNYNLLTPDISGNDYQLTDIINYMKGALFAYDGRRNNVWCCNPNEDFSLVYNLKTKQWTMSTIVFSEVIDFGGIFDTVNGEIYSRYLVRIEGTVQILSGEDLSSKVYTHLLTRPIKIQTPDQYKKIQELISRCELYRDDSNGYFTFWSVGKQDLNRDKVNIPLVAYVDSSAATFPNNIRQDIPVGKMKGKYKAITILQGGNLLPSSSLDNFEIVAIAVENNKLR